MTRLLAVVLVVAILENGVQSDILSKFPKVDRSGVNSRIVSGWEASEGQIPYQLSLRMINSEGSVTACSGSLIHGGWGLTAAHCVALQETIVVRAGAVNLTRPAAIFESTMFYTHPAYIDHLSYVVQPHDIALIGFGRSLELNDRIQPIRLQRSVHMDRNYERSPLTASGWGATSTGGSSTENLRWVYLSGISNAACSAAYGFHPIITSSTVCAVGWSELTQAVCTGDNGGPLVVIDEDDKLTQIGVMSFIAASGCHTGDPSGFIRPGHYHDWFVSTTGIDFDWEPKDSSEESVESQESSESEEDESIESSGDFEYSETLIHDLDSMESFFMKV